MWPDARLAPFVVIAALALPLAAAGVDEEYHKAIATIRCDCGCHPQTVGDCACGHAAEMRETIRAMIVAPDGTLAMSADEVIAQYVAESGEQIRIAPAAAGFNLLAWLGPLVGLVLGLVGAVALIRAMRHKHTALPAGSAALPGPKPSADDAAHRETLRRQLEEWD